MNRIRLVATDMDGTLLNSRKEIPRGFKPWVLAHPEVRVVIASGRQYPILRRDFEDIREHLLFITDNGGFVYENDEIIYSLPMPEELILLYLEEIRKLPGVVPVLCGARAAYMEHASLKAERDIRSFFSSLEFCRDIRDCLGRDILVKIALYIPDQHTAAVEKALRSVSEEARPVISGAEWIDIGTLKVNKGEAIRAVQKKYGISREESMAFGDFMNDLEMLGSCGESYAMANAHPAVKAAAAHTAPSNDAEGVMRILEKVQIL